MKNDERPIADNEGEFHRSEATPRVTADPNFRIENWPLSDVLFQLATWVKHLGGTHDCDCHGWEARSFLIQSALVYQDQQLDLDSLKQRVAELTRGLKEIEVCDKCDLCEDHHAIKGESQ